MRKRFILATLLAWSATSLFAQDEAPLFRTDTTLVEFTLIARDKDGNPVTDLKREDIVVKDKGRDRELAVFRYEGGQQTLAAPDLSPGIFTNTPALTPGPTRNVTAIILDTLNTQPREQIWIKMQLLRNLSRLLTNSRVAIYSLGRELTVLHDFTDDAEPLRETLDQIRFQLPPKLGSINDMTRDMDAMISRLRTYQLEDWLIEILVNVERRAQESAGASRTRYTLSSLEALGDHLAGIPGRKSIVWFGSGISMLSITGSLERHTPASNRSYSDYVRNTSRRLAQQGITMYMFDARGMQTTSDMSVENSRITPATMGAVDPFERIKANAAISADPVPAMAAFADITGGRFYWNSNDVGGAMDEVLADSEGTYSVGFYAEGEPDDRWHNLNVKVARRGVKLKYRDGYLSATQPDTPLDWTEEQWQAVVYNPLGSTAVRMDARLQFDEGGEADTVSMILQLVADDLKFREVDGQMSASVDLAVVDKLPNAQGRVQRVLREVNLPQGEFAEVGVAHVRHTWQLTPGAATVRLIVHDRITGRYGTLDVPVKSIPHLSSASN